MGRTASGSIARGTITVAGPPIGESDGGNQLERGPIGVVPSVGAALASPNGAVGGQAAQGAPTSVGPTGGATDALFHARRAGRGGRPRRRPACASLTSRPG
jgi:hypothetical protein